MVSRRKATDWICDTEKLMSKLPYVQFTCFHVLFFLFIIKSKKKIAIKFNSLGFVVNCNL